MTTVQQKSRRAQPAPQRTSTPFPQGVPPWLASALSRGQETVAQARLDLGKQRLRLVHPGDAWAQSIADRAAHLGLSLPKAVRHG